MSETQAIRVICTREEISLAVLALRESAAAGKIAAARMELEGNPVHKAFAAKAERMARAAKMFSDAL